MSNGSRCPPCRAESAALLSLQARGITVHGLVYKDKPAPARDFWRSAYPALATRASNRAALLGAGYQPVADFALPESDWWDGYYALLEPRIATLRARVAGDAAAQAALDAAQSEIDLYRAHGASYGYVFYVARRA